MTKTGKLLRRATKTAVTTVKKAAKVVERKVEREVRRRQVRRVLREAAGVAVTTGAGVLAAAAIEESVQVVRRRRKAARNAAFEAALPVAPELAIEKVTEALKAEGFGILTRIDTHHVFQQKLGISFRPFTILGACNPHLAHRALSHSALVGLLLPCNVTVEAADAGGSIIRIANPEAMLAAGALERDPILAELMADAKGRLSRVADHLAEAAG